MEQTISADIPTGRMWRIYAGGWALYLLILVVSLHVSELQHGRVGWYLLLEFSWAAPPAAILALLWPLTGWLERRRLPPTGLLFIHLAGAFVYGVLTYLLMWFLFGFRKPLDWYLWPVLYAMMTYGIIAIAFIMVRTNAARRRQEARLQQIQALLVASELNALRNKLNPHFLFNTLHSIIALTRKDPDAAEAALFQFSDMLRYLLDTEKTGSDRVTLDDELRFTRDYLELESLRLGARLRVDWELDDRAAEQRLPALSLQPLVENSIKHAFNPHARPGRLAIRTCVDAGMLTLTVRDDGPGADMAAVRASNGLGIRTVDRRLQLEYGAGSALAIETAPGAGFAVTMSIPLEPAT
jgi:sensor histidine kinase YesM